MFILTVHMFWFALLTLYVSCVPTEYFVSSISGSDKNPGTIDKPFRTMNHARQVVRSISNFVDDIYVNIMEGEYFESIKFDYLDSGKDGKNVVYRAYKTSNPVITGGRVIDDWTIDPAGYWVTNVGNNTKTRQLYVNGKRATRCRGGKLPSEAKKVDEFGFIVPKDAEILKYKNPSQIEFYSNDHWRQTICRVGHFVPDKGEIHMQEPCWTLALRMIHAPDWIENAFEVFNEEGEWYLNENTGILYYKPRKGEVPTNTTVIIPTLERLIYGIGTVDKPVSNLLFYGLTFTYSGWTRPSLAGHGFTERQANILQDGSIPIGSVEFTFGHQIRIIQCMFTNVGATGLLMNNGTKNAHIESNVFTYTSSHGFKIGDNEAIRLDNRQISENNVAWNNTVMHPGQDYPGAPAIVFAYVRNCTLSHSLVLNAPYTGIHNGWGWRAEFSNFAGWNTFDSNWVENVTTVMFDGGCLYTLGQQNGTVISNNVFLRNRHLYGSLYLDDGSRYLTVYRNVVWDNAETALIKGGDHYIHDMWWQDRGKCPSDIPDVYFEPYYGPNKVENIHKIKSFDEAPRDIIDNAGLVKTHKKTNVLNI